jgi:hypothetical protein
MSNIDIRKIEEELKKRLYYEKAEEEKYKKEYNEIYDKMVPNDSKPYDNRQTGSINESKPFKDLKKTKLMNIRKNLDDDKGFNEIEGQLPYIKNMIIEKKKELKSLTGPKSPDFFQRAYTSVRSKKNTADMAKVEFVK